MDSPTQRKAGVLTHLGTNTVSLPTLRDVWPQRPGVKDSFWVMDDEMSLGAAIRSRALVTRSTRFIKLYSKITLKERVLLWILV